MEWLKNMSLKKSFFLLSVGCVFVSLVLIILVFLGCGAIREDYPASGISLSLDGAVTCYCRTATHVIPDVLA